MTESMVGKRHNPSPFGGSIIGRAARLASRSVKRGTDLAVATTGLLVLGPTLGLVGIAVKLDTPGPVFYRGVRVGRHGVPFRIFKFRSMRVHDGSGPDTTSELDNRITRVGKLIRALKIDEVAQLINVLKGDMSLVGPRPEVQWCVDLYTEDEKKILTVRPGITDWASIKFNNEGEIIKNSGIADPDEAYLKLIRPEKLRLQLKYVEERTMVTDLSILWETLAVLWRTRVSSEVHHDQSARSESTGTT